MKSLFFTHLFVLIFFVYSSAAEAKDYHRSCHVRIFVENQDDHHADAVTIDELTATASAGWYIPNTIRLRAYRKARSCLSAAWALSDSYGTPTECTEANGITGFDIGSMNHTIRREACPAWSSPASVHVRVRAHIWGDNGCGGSRTTKSAYLTLGSRYEVGCP